MKENPAIGVKEGKNEMKKKKELQGFCVHALLVVIAFFFFLA